MTELKTLALILLSSTIFAGCATSRKVQMVVDCRKILVEDHVQTEIEADLKARFPNYREAFVSGAGLKLHAEGIRYYPASVKTRDGKTYSIIYSYSPEDEECKRLGFQFVQLDPKKP